MSSYVSPKDSETGNPAVQAENGKALNIQSESDKLGVPHFPHRNSFPSISISEFSTTSSTANLVGLQQQNGSGALEAAWNPDEDLEERAEWGGKLEFILTCVGYAVGLGNVWRFPYLCGKNGGGAFLIPFTIMLVAVGIPVVFLEVSFGQFASQGPVNVWKVNPLFIGLGYGAVSITWLLIIYYNVIVAWATHFFISSMRSELLWVDCKPDWASPTCMDNHKWGIVDKVSNWTNGSEILRNLSISLNNTSTPGEDYFYNHVLNISQGMEEMGAPQWQLVLCLLFAWTVIFLVLWRGIQTLGKVSYFTAVFPYILLTALLIRGVMLPGAAEGLRYYVTPQWHRLADAEVWSEAATQIFYSLSACGGGLIAMSSFNKFSNNTLRDTIIVSVVTWLTCIFAGAVVFAFLGYIAYIKKTDMETVASASGPGLVFIVYPEGLSQMPLAPFWSVLFFFMLMTLGFSSSFSNAETVFTTIMEVFPGFLKGGRRPLIFRAVGCFGFFLLGIPMVTRGGFHLFNIMDTQVGGYPLLMVGIFELIVISWVYGYDNFKEDIELMLGFKISIFWKIAWCYVSPLVLIATSIMKAVAHAPLVTIFNRPYPPFAVFLAWCIVAFSMAWIPGMFLYRYCIGGGFMVLRSLSQPDADWGPRLDTNKNGRYEKTRKMSSITTIQISEYNERNAAAAFSYDNMAQDDESVCSKL